jgi:prefoldin subunit 5
MNRIEKKNKLLLAKPDIDCAIKKHGLDAVRYVVARRVELEKAKRNLAAEKSKLQKRMEEIEAKLARK